LNKERPGLVIAIALYPLGNDKILSISSHFMRARKTKYVQVSIPLLVILIFGKIDTKKLPNTNGIDQTKPTISKVIETSDHRSQRVNPSDIIDNIPISRYGSVPPMITK